MIELTNISYSYPDSPALANINLSIKKSEPVAFIGPNGSGKSTLLKILGGILYPDKGTYFFDHQHITRHELQSPKTAKNFHQRIGFLFQNVDAQLFTPLVREEIAFGPRQLGLSEEEVISRVNDCLALLEIKHLEDRVPYHLSEGEKKRVAIASLLALNPDVLILDEPMSGLDPKMKRFLADLIQSLRGSGKTLICSTHEFKYMEGLFERAVVISDEHKIVRDGYYANIMTDVKVLQEYNIL